MDLHVLVNKIPWSCTDPICFKSAKIKACLYTFVLELYAKDAQSILTPRKEKTTIIGLTVQLIKSSFIILLYFCRQAHENYAHYGWSANTLGMFQTSKVEKIAAKIHQSFMEHKNNSHTVNEIPKWGPA